MSQEACLKSWLKLMKSSSPSLTFIVVPGVAVGCYVGGVFGVGREGGEVSVLGWCLNHCKKATRRATQLRRSQLSHATLLNRHSPQSHDTCTSRQRSCHDATDEKGHVAEHNR